MHDLAADRSARWREELLTTVLRITLVFGSAAAVLTVVFAVSAGLHHLVVVDVLAVGLIAWATIHRRLPYPLRTTILLGTTFGLGVLLLNEVALVGLTFLLAFPVLTAALLRLRAVMLALAINAVTLVLIATVDAVDLGEVVPGLTGPYEGTVVAANLLLVNAVMALPCAYLLRRMEASLREELEMSASLAKERAALDANNRQLEREARDRAQAEASQRFHAQLLRAVGEAVVATDRDGRVRYVNPAAQGLYGVTEAQAVGRSIDGLVDLGLGDSDLQDILATVLNGATWTGETEVDLPDGSRLPVLATTAPFRDRDGEVAGLIAVSTDISQLRDTIDQLARSEEIRVAFLRATSHELRTPIAAIVGLAETLQRLDGELDDAGRAQLTERLAANADRLSHLINDLLDVDRLAAGLVTADRQPQELDALVTRAIDEVDTGGRSVETDLVPLTVEVDAPKIERVIANLVANAVRHTAPDREISVRLRDDDGMAQLVVEDDGDGVDPRYLDVIFEPFVQGPERHTDARPGTGLGLALTRELVELHGGTITASNRRPRGCRFEVRLPRST